MKHFWLTLLLISSAQAAERKPAANVPGATLERLKKIYSEQSEAMLMERIIQADSAFQKWRSFPPYYYDLLGRAGDSLPADFYARKGTCAGDPHLENFGFIFRQPPLFTVNDLDDVAPCPLNADMLRLFMGHRLVASVSGKEFLEAYKVGLGGNKSLVYPDYIKQLEKDSVKKHTKLSKKYRKLLAEGCSGEFSALESRELKHVNKFMLKEKKTLLKACGRIKETGGSAGAKRFVLFFPQGAEVEALELKPLMRPAPMVHESITELVRQDMYRQAVSIFFGKEMQAHYYPVRLDGKLYQRRPLWAGNEGVAAEDISSKELKEIMLFEARLLGYLHARTNSQTVEYTPEQLESIARELEKRWRAEFGE